MLIIGRSGSGGGSSTVARSLREQMLAAALPAVSSAPTPLATSPPVPQAVGDWVKTVAQQHGSQHAWLVRCSVWGNTLCNVEIGCGANPLLVSCKVHHGLQAGVHCYEAARGRLIGCEIYANGPKELTASPCVYTTFPCLSLCFRCLSVP